MIVSVLEAGAVVGCVINMNLWTCIVAVTRGEEFLPIAIGSNYNLHVLDPSSSRLGFFWLGCSLLCLIALASKQGGLKPPSIQTAARSSPVSRQKVKEPPAYNQPPPTSVDAYNMFDPADLPPRLAEYANMVYSACEDLGNFFGFQDSSVRNQAEHLLILLSNNRRYMNNHILPQSHQPPSPIHALHAKVFSNYMKWCRAMGILPNFARMSSTTSAPPAVASRVVDLVLFFSIWGESSNVRHMPECLWFLYHKMMEDYIVSEGYTQTRSLYAGHFVDNVVEPIFKVVEKVSRNEYFTFQHDMCYYFLTHLFLFWTEYENEERTC